MKPYLLDINVLIALAWPSHVHHDLAQRWFAARRAAGFSTCPLTQLAFVRISSNPAFTPEAVSPRQALDLLERITSLPEHAFWLDELPVNRAMDQQHAIMAHRQITDAYLLELARTHGATLATLDRGVLLLAGATPELVELLGQC